MKILTSLGYKKAPKVLNKADNLLFLLFLLTNLFFSSVKTKFGNKVDIEVYSRGSGRIEESLGSRFRG